MIAWGGPRFVFSLAALLAVPLQADLKVRIKDTFGSLSSTRIEYYKSQLQRTDTDRGSYTIVDSLNRRTITVDATHREYSVYSFGATVQPETVDQTIVFDIEARDTGEQRRVFGHTARHIFTTERRHTEYRDQPPGDTQETVTDGWYLDIPGPYARRTAAVLVVAVSRQPGDRPSAPSIKTNGQRPRGLPIWEKDQHRLTEVVGLSEAPLDPRLFEPPSGFRQVDQVRVAPVSALSWSDRVSLSWERLLDWLGGIL